MILNIRPRRLCWLRRRGGRSRRLHARFGCQLRHRRRTTGWPVSSSTPLNSTDQPDTTARPAGPPETTEVKHVQASHHEPPEHSAPLICGIYSGRQPRNHQTADPTAGRRTIRRLSPNHRRLAGAGRRTAVSASVGTSRAVPSYVAQVRDESRPPASRLPLIVSDGSPTVIADVSTASKRAPELSREEGGESPARRCAPVCPRRGYERSLRRRRDERRDHVGRRPWRLTVDSPGRGG